MPFFILLRPRWKNENYELNKFMSYAGLINEIQELRVQIIQKEEIFDFGMYSNQALERIKEMHVEISKLKRQLEILLEKNYRLVRN